MLSNLCVAPSQVSYAKVLKSNDGNERSTSSTSNNNNSSSSSPLQLPKPKRELFDKSKIQIGWGSAGVLKWGAGSGFNNVGNTCYLNSALQAFLHVPAIAQWLISDKEHRDKCQRGKIKII
jgi:ubiquitin carboxyl-terminal hydrolase 36/42